MLSRGQKNLSQGAYFSAQAGQNVVARAEKFISGSVFLCISRAVYWCEGRENFYRQQISQSKPGSMLSRGQKNLSQGAYFSAQAGQNVVARAEKFSTDSRFLSPSRAYTVMWAEKFIPWSRFLSPSRGYTVMWAEKFIPWSRFLSPSRTYTVMWAEKIQNIRHIIDNISVQAGRYAVERAEKISTDSRFLSLSRAECCREGRKIYLRERISLPKPGSMLVRGQKNLSQGAYFSAQAGQYAGARAEKFISGSVFLCLSRAVCCRKGREIYSMEQISQSKPDVYCHEGRENFYRQQISQSKPGGMLSRGQRNCLQIADFSVQAGQNAVARAESSAHMCSKICKKAYLFDKEKHLW